MKYTFEFAQVREENWQRAGKKVFDSVRDAAIAGANWLDVCWLNDYIVKIRVVETDLTQT